MAGTAGATGLVNGADVTGATGDVKPIVLDVGSEILRGRGMETGVGFATGDGAEKSNGAEIWIREVAGRDFGTEVAWVLEAGRIVALFLSDSRSESKEMVIFFAVGAGAGVMYEVGVD